MLYNRAYVSAKCGDVDKALELWGKASALKGKIGDVSGQVKSIHNMQRAAKSPNSSEPPRRQDAKLLNFLAPWRLGGCFFGFLAGR